ncbi:MAG TPA: response regulator transcription factor [Arenibaculum sp.]|nr:response regulator transcription factor [Arenibaculum sp.]
MSMNSASHSSSPRPQAARPQAIGANIQPVRVALVDDDDLFRESLGMNLSDEGFDVVPFNRGQPALDYFRTGGQADIVLLDWRMPRMDGIDVLKQLRSSGIEVPVIFLTVLSDQIYEEAALAGGAVDFVEKSRSLPILLKRMQLIVDGRKGDPVEQAGEADLQETGTFVRGDLELRLEGSRALWQGTRIDLTLTEFNIVKLLVTKAGQDISYREIYDLVHGKGFVAGYGPAGYRANVRAFIKRIRQKFRAVDTDFDLIYNYPGFGYRWSEEDAGRGMADDDEA